MAHASITTRPLSPRHWPPHVTSSSTQVARNTLLHDRNARAPDSDCGGNGDVGETIAGYGCVVGKGRGCAQRGRWRGGRGSCGACAKPRTRKVNKRKAISDVFAPRRGNLF